MSQITSRRANRRMHGITGGSASVAAMIIEQVLLRGLYVHKGQESDEKQSAWIYQVPIRSDCFLHGDDWLRGQRKSTASLYIDFSKPFGIVTHLNPCSQTGKPVWIGLHGGSHTTTLLCVRPQ